MKHRILYTIASLLLVIMLYLGLNAYNQALNYETQTKALIDQHGPKVQAKLKLEKFAKQILGDLYDEDVKVNLDKVNQEKEYSRLEAIAYTKYFMVVLLLLLLMYFVMPIRAYTFFIGLAAMMSLLLGLISPILMVTIHKNVEYLGDIILSFESKGILGSIDKLWGSGDYVVALVILLFSVIMPMLKILSLLFIVIFVEHKFAQHIVTFFKLIGKWSMLDVFVVAIFLVYLTANKGDVSRAEIEVGLYFFLAYVLVSMLVNISASFMLNLRLKFSQS